MSRKERQARRAEKIDKYTKEIHLFILSRWNRRVEGAKGEKLTGNTEFLSDTFQEICGILLRLNRQEAELVREAATRYAKHWESEVADRSEVTQ